MEQIQFYICDVFCIEKNTGNQLAVFIDNGQLTQDQMQMMAAEINFSECTFIDPKPNPDGSFNVRIFTPKSEIPFAGHPSLGTAYIIQNKLKDSLTNKVILRLKAGDIPVKTEYGIWWMEQIHPSFGKKFDPELVSQIIQTPIDDFTESPIEEVSTGLPFIIIQLKSLYALKKCKIDLKFIEDHSPDYKEKDFLVFCQEGYAKNQHLGIRVFVPWLGIPEDPATGSANGCLAAYILKNNIFSSTKINLISGQGYEINRPSELYMNASKENDNYSIFIGGKVDLVAEGKWIK